MHSACQIIEGKTMRVQRLNSILEYIESRQVCSYEDICSHFQISLSTARRDINTLIQNHTIRKVYGGVTAVPGTSSTIDSAFNPNEDSDADPCHISHKLDYIGKLAAAFVEPDDVIYIGSGATAFHILPYLKNTPHLTIVTNNLLVATNDPKSNKDIILIGGKIDYYTQSTVGIQTIDSLKALNINKAFVSCNGLSLNKGFSNAGDSEIAIKKCIFENSETIYMLADSTKFDKLSLYTFATFQDIDYLITDMKPAEPYIDILEKNHVSLVC